jgi:hypothetical protein
VAGQSERLHDGERLPPGRAGFFGLAALVLDVADLQERVDLAEAAARLPVQLDGPPVARDGLVGVAGAAG